MFEKDISQLSKPEIKGRGFIGSGKEIIETQTYFTMPENDWVFDDTMLLTYNNPVYIEQCKRKGVTVDDSGFIPQKKLDEAEENTKTDDDFDDDDDDDFDDDEVKPVSIPIKKRSESKPDTPPPMMKTPPKSEKKIDTPPSMMKTTPKSTDERPNHEFSKEDIMKALGRTEEPKKAEESTTVGEPKSIRDKLNDGTSKMESNVKVNFDKTAVDEAQAPTKPKLKLNQTNKIKLNLKNKNNE